MAKKVVAKLQKKGAKGITKIIKMVKSPKSGSYMFKEKLVISENAKKELKDLK